MPANSNDLPKLWVRLPADVKEWLEKQSLRNASSQNSEIVRCIRDRMERDAATSAAKTTGQMA